MRLIVVICILNLPNYCTSLIITLDISNFNSNEMVAHSITHRFNDSPLIIKLKLNLIGPLDNQPLV